MKSHSSRCLGVHNIHVLCLNVNRMKQSNSLKRREYPWRSSQSSFHFFGEVQPVCSATSLGNAGGSYLALLLKLRGVNVSKCAGVSSVTIFAGTSDSRSNTIDFTETEGCTWYTFFTDGFCNIMETCTEIVAETCPICVSGE